MEAAYPIHCARLYVILVLVLNGVAMQSSTGNAKMLDDMPMRVAAAETPDAKRHEAPRPSCAEVARRMTQVAGQVSPGKKEWERYKDAFLSSTVLSRSEWGACFKADETFHDTIRRIYLTYFRFVMLEAYQHLEARSRWEQGRDFLDEMLKSVDVYLAPESPEHQYAARKRQLFHGLLANESLKQLSAYFDADRGYQYFRNEEEIVRGLLEDIGQTLLKTHDFANAEFGAFFQNTLLPLCRQGEHRKALRRLLGFERKPNEHVGGWRLAGALIYELWGDFERDRGRYAEAIIQYGLSGVAELSYQTHLRPKMLLLLQSHRLPFADVQHDPRLRLWIRQDAELRAAFVAAARVERPAHP